MNATPNKDIRRCLVDMVQASGAAHIGSALSMVEIGNAIYKGIDVKKIKAGDPLRDRVFLSKGHATAGLYAVLYHHGLITDKEIKTYFKNGTVLAGTRQPPCPACGTFHRCAWPRSACSARRGHRVEVKKIRCARLRYHGRRRTSRGFELGGHHARRAFENGQPHDLR